MIIVRTVVCPASVQICRFKKAIISTELSFKDLYVFGLIRVT